MYDEELGKVDLNLDWLTEAWKVKANSVRDGWSLRLYDEQGECVFRVIEPGFTDCVRVACEWNADTPAGIGIDD